MKIDENIQMAVGTALIDSCKESIEELRPELIFNDVHQGMTVLANLEVELKKCKSFWFSIAFVTQSGLIILKDILKELELKGISGKILTTNYLGFNEPTALRDLLKFSNLKVKVYSAENFHTKGYMFVNDELRTLYVGSSNLTQGALKKNKEWNLKITSLENGLLIKNTDTEFFKMWKDAESLTEDWITDYENYYKQNKRVNRTQKVLRINSYKLQPNKMQKSATKALTELRAQNKNKALIISATGTGKTYLSAFDVRNFVPKKMLFLVHRDRILDQAIESYKDVLGEGIRVGKLSSKSNNRDYEADYIFASMATMAKEEYRMRYTQKYFDYIIIDETHRAAAESYQKILNYFIPKFLLGMTATPELSDGRDIYDLYDNNIAYEIRLQQAMEYDLLCPFHYFGISELKIDDVPYKDKMFKDTFKYLTSSERIEHIIYNINFYGYSGKRAHGLIFCRRIEEANELSRLFNERGFQTMVVSSKSDLIFKGKKITISEVIDLLEQEDREGGLDYIFTVDMFNEGVDIPSVNQIIMLRPTESPVVFVQQLGRGLRKAPGKEYLVVLDFIGNYSNNFMIPIALSGDRSYNKDNLRKYIVEGTRVIPGCSTIHFDAIAKERIFNSIDKINGVKKIIKESYINLKYKLGHIPSLVDFYDNGEVDPLLILDKYKTYFAFLKEVEETYKKVYMSENEKVTLEYLSKIIARGKRPHEIEILKSIITQGTFSKKEMIKSLEENYKISNCEKGIDAAIAVLEGSFVTNAAENEKYSHIDILFKKNEGFYERMISFYERLSHVEFRNQVNDIVELGLKRYQDIYDSETDKRDEFVLYEKYSRRDVCWLLNWGKDLSSTMYGMKRIKDNVGIFVTYNKAISDDEREYLQGKPDYADEFVNNSKQIFMWNSQIGKGPKSSYMQDVCQPKRKHLFIKKSDAEGTDFYYMGLFDILEITGDKKKDNNGKLKEISKVKLRLHDPIRDDLRDYLESY